MLTGTVRATGQIASTAAGGLGAITGILGKDLGRGVEKLAGRTLDQRTDIRGNVAVISRPRLTPAWRLEPNLTTQFAIADANMTIVGVRLNVGNEVRPLLERQVNEQVARLQARLRNDPFLEQVARREWAKLCRSLSIGAAGAGLPNLWLELRPKRAIAAQPRIDAEAVTLLIGVEAETRIVPKETKPECPFPATLEIAPQTEQGRVAIAVPIDVPFTEVNRLIEAQFAGKTFRGRQRCVRRDGAPRQRGGVRRSAADLAAGAGPPSARAGSAWVRKRNVYVWGRPVLDPKTQVLRLTDVKLDRRIGRRAGRRGARGGALSRSGCGGADRDRPQAVRRQCAQEHRGGDRRVPCRR